MAQVRQKWKATELTNMFLTSWWGWSGPIHILSHHCQTLPIFWLTWNNWWYMVRAFFILLSLYYPLITMEKYQHNQKSGKFTPFVIFNWTFFLIIITTGFTASTVDFTAATTGCHFTTPTNTWCWKSGFSEDKYKLYICLSCRADPVWSTIVTCHEIMALLLVRDLEHCLSSGLPLAHGPLDNTHPTFSPYISPLNI